MCDMPSAFRSVTRQAAKQHKLKDPIFTIDGGRIVTTSRAIADACGVQHVAVLKLVRKYRRELYRVEAPAKLEMREIKITGRPGEAAVLDERQALFIVSLMKNSPIVVLFKEKLILELFNHREARSRLGADVVVPGQALAWLLDVDEADHPSSQ